MPILRQNRCQMNMNSLPFLCICLRRHSFITRAPNIFTYQITLYFCLTPLFHFSLEKNDVQGNGQIPGLWVCRVHQRMRSLRWKLLTQTYPFHSGWVAGQPVTWLWACDLCTALNSHHTAAQKEVKSPDTGSQSGFVSWVLHCSCSSRPCYLKVIRHSMAKTIMRSGFPLWTLAPWKAGSLWSSRTGRVEGRTGSVGRQNRPGQFWFLGQLP